ncbi:response regulator [Halosquirtibacter xylanolyticus]|uniref:hybrid sensor histidine kinase/response regulator transcription factor n=1 Tax=Halosquirtibacter xylanolyticus TaxID=3374599 RepID=UPI003748F581|nr:response regulator [Prolixibacteraceae bacterium]
MIRVLLFELLLFVGVVNRVSAEEMSDFDRYTMSNGLSNNTISSLLQDDQGYLWVGTYDGLNRYDGYNWSTFRKSEDPTSIKSNHINRLVSYHDTILIATDEGLSFYNKNSRDFKTVSISNRSNRSISDIWVSNDTGIWCSVVGKGLYHSEDGISTSWKWRLNEAHIVALDKDKVDEHIWLATLDGSLISYSTLTTHTERFFLPSSQIVDIHVRGPYVWIATESQGVVLFDKRTKEFAPFHLPSRAKVIRKIHEDQNENLWITTDGDGVYCVSKEGKIKRHFNFSGSPGILSILVDRQGVVWYGTVGLGLWAQNPMRSYYGYRKVNSGSLDKDLLVNNIISLYEWSKDTLLIGTDGAGLWMYDLKRMRMTSANIFPTLEAKVIKSISEDDSGTLWIGTYKEGVFKLSKNSKYWNHYTSNSELNDRLPSNSIWTIASNREDVFLGTLGKGVVKYEPQKGFKTLSKYRTQGIQLNEYILTSLVDQQNTTWFGSSNGLFKLDNSTQKLTSYYSDPTNKNGRGASAITSLMQDQSHAIWMGTNGAGIAKKEDDSLVWINESNGLINNTVYAILEDAHMSIWIMTNRGISILDKSRQKLTNLDESNGLHALQFTCALKLHDGRFVLGTVGGFYVFNPEKVHYQIPTPRLILEDLSLVDGEFSTPVDLSKDSLSVQWFPKYDALHLKFVGIDYIQKEKAVYSYSIDGYTDKWYKLEEQRFLTLMGLPYGDFTLRIRAGYPNTNKFSNEVVIPISVIRPWWRTKAAFFLYLMILLFTLWVYQKLSNRFYFLKKEAEIESLNSKRKQEFHRIRMEMFTKMAHEFMTPLTLILAPIKEMLEKSNIEGEQRSKLNLVYQQSVYLKKLAENILSFQKMNISKLRLNARFFDIDAMAERKVHEFQELAGEKNIEIQYDVQTERPLVALDFEKIEAIITNLLSNAVKYSDKNGGIIHLITTVKESNISIGEGVVHIEVSDNGIGIPKHKQAKIFDPFFRVDEESKEEGAGIGLSIVKDFVDLHQGQITLESKQGDGTTFRITIPCKIKEAHDVEELPKVNKLPSPVKSTKVLGNRARCLIVDDHPSMLQYIQELLSEQYDVMIAINGEEGYKKATSFMPDIILTDLMMPKVDGIELLSLLKKNIITSHIPVIVLSAKHVVEAKMASVDEGAELYLSKPFDPLLLKSYIASILQNRARLAQKRKEVPLSIEKEVSSEVDSKWVASLRKLVLSNLDNPELGVSFVCEKSHMSRTSMHRKLKAICSMSTTEYINSLRLEQSITLLKSRKYQVTEVAYMVGFNNASYFTRAFHKRFGVSPSEYVSSL